jgi:hypothetical protein
MRLLTPITVKVPMNNPSLDSMTHLNSLVSLYDWSSIAITEYLKVCPVPDWYT